MRRQNWIFHKSLFYKFGQSAFYKTEARKTGRMQRFGLYPAEIFRAVVIPPITVYPIPAFHLIQPFFFLCIYVSSLWDISHTLCCLFVFTFLVHIYQSHSLFFLCIYISCPYISVTLWSLNGTFSSQRDCDYAPALALALWIIFLSFICLFVIFMSMAILFNMICLSFACFWVCYRHFLALSEEQKTQK